MISTLNSLMPKYRTDEEKEKGIREAVDYTRPILMKGVLTATRELPIGPEKNSNRAPATDIPTDLAHENTEYEESFTSPEERDESSIESMGRRSTNL